MLADGWLVFGWLADGWLVFGLLVFGLLVFGLLFGGCRFVVFQSPSYRSCHFLTPQSLSLHLTLPYLALPTIPLNPFDH
jgi:hypothetical protein